MLLLLQCFHTVRAPPILLYRHYSPDQLISRTRGPITRDLSVHGDLNVNPNYLVPLIEALVTWIAYLGVVTWDYAKCYNRVKTKDNELLGRTFIWSWDDFEPGEVYGINTMYLKTDVQ